MQAQGIRTTLSSNLNPIEAHHATASVDWLAVRRAASRWLRSPLLQVRPRVSLLTGSALVLLSLYIPVAFNACGAHRTGHEFLLGQGWWPGMAGLVDMKIERGVYAFGVALAAFTLLMLLVTLRRPALMERAWVKWPFLTAGVVSLFAVADFAWFNLSTQIAPLLKSQFGLDKPEIILPMVDALAIFVMALCLRSKFLRSQRWIVGLFGVESAVCLLAMAAGFLEQFHATSLVSRDTVIRMSASPGILYWVVPTALWIRFGFSRNEERRALWERLRPRIIILYLPAGVIVGALFFWPDTRAVWGVAPYLAGLSLISLGYAELAHRLPSAPPSKDSLKGTAGIFGDLGFSCEVAEIQECRTSIPLIQEMKMQESLDLLARARLGRLACVKKAQPYIVPFYFTYHDNSLYSFSTVGQKIEWMRANPLVCVEVDEVVSSQHWVSVILSGRYEELPDTPEWRSAREFAYTLLQKTAAWWEPGYVKTILYGEERPMVPVFYRIHIAQITGHRATPEAVPLTAAPSR